MDVSIKHENTPCVLRPVDTIVTFSKRGGNRWERALRDSQGRVTMSDHAIERCIRRHPDRELVLSWSCDLDAVRWMRDAIRRSVLKGERVYKQGLPTFELLDPVSNMVFRAQKSYYRVVVATCFELGVDAEMVA